MSSEKVIIVGAGVAGLSLAIMLAEQNIESEVLEARERFDGPTSGVRVSAEGVEVLKLMQVDAVGHDSRKVYLRFGSLAAAFSNPDRAASAIVVTRLALHEQLMKRAQTLGVRVVTGFNVAAVVEANDGVEAVSTSGERVTGTVLVGADGVGSKFRQILNPDQGSTKTYAGYLGVGLITRDEAEIEMTLHHYPGHQVGIASCGRVNAAASCKSIFMWTHIRMPEAEAKLATRESVEAELTRRAERWSADLKGKFEFYTRDAEAVLAYGPVYNGKPPVRWYSSRMILIGDAAHPYGPGGQGISMALKDARALATVIANGFTEADKKEFQHSRARESRSLGEKAETRNAKTPPSTWSGVIAEGVAVKLLEIFNRGRLEI